MSSDPKKAFPPRTRATSLSDDELLLCDFMFDKRVPERVLRRDVYPEHVNAQLTPWKSFPVVASITARVPVEQSGFPEWIAYERRRVWWQSIGELSTLPRG